ncbi:MAG: glycosyltransferase family 1 protein [Pseudomonadota bacterium]
MANTQSRIIIISDAWHPQVNGVVRIIERTMAELENRGFTCQVIGPDQFKTIPAPTYPEIRLALAPYGKLKRLLRDLPRMPTNIHIATEGPLGWAARRYCLKHKIPFTTAYHTKFPEYVAARAPIPMTWTYRLMRYFHDPSTSVKTHTPSVKALLETKGLKNVSVWYGGVDVELFQPREPIEIGLPRPLAIYVGRVAVEKNIEAFLDAEFAGSKLVVGGGPALASLTKAYPHVTFVGAKHGEELARYYSTGDVFAFPSLTDTFGLVVVEALACGVPVAAYPVTGPSDILTGEPGGDKVGVLDDDLAKAMAQALTLDRRECRPFAMAYSWSAATTQFLSHFPPAVPVGQAESTVPDTPVAVSAQERV